MHDEFQSGAAHLYVWLLTKPFFMLNTLKVAAVAAFCAVLMGAENKPATKPSLTDSDKIALLKTQVQIESLNSQYNATKVRFREQETRLEAAYKAESDRLQQEKAKLLKALQRPGFLLDETAQEYAPVGDAKK